MSYHIFNSLVTLRYKDKHYEAKYKEKHSLRRKYNIFLSLFLTCLIISVSILMIVDYSDLDGSYNTRYSTMFCFITGALSIIITLLCIIVKGNKFQEWLTYVSYILILFVFANLRYYLVWVIKIDLLIYTLIFVIEMIFRLMWFELGLIDFVPGVYLQLTSMVINFCIFAPILPRNYFFRFSVYNCILILTSIMSYFLIREQKRSFYYNLSLKLQNQWYESIIDNMNSGFISIKDREIQYFNKILLSFFREPYNSDVQSNNNNDVIIVNNIDINKLFNNILLDNCAINDFEQVATILNNKYNDVGDNFIFLGTKDIKVKPTCCTYLEVFGRYYKVSDRYEFIFNDITRSKQIEQKNAEFKYKTLFLSKIAHEFKNPLLCISELVEQVYDTLLVSKHINGENNNLQILQQIKSMSNYLILLVKDMDFFSQKNSGTIKKKIELDKVNLSDTVKFCKDIVDALIQKSHKQAKIDFHIVKDKNIPTFITTDEMKLKQIIINLLSNAVKYTFSGSIYLKISLEGKQLKFQVDDTGKGISESQRDKLFTPFANEFDKLNKISSGLGLSIVKEMIEMLGSKIEYSSTVNKGSSFWFSLELAENDLDFSYISDTTVKEVHFNDQPIQNKLSFYCATNSTSTNTIVSLEAKHNIIVVDDDIIIRQASIRLLHKVFKEKKLSVKILEAADGIECLNIYYEYLKDGRNISFIISDETMMYMNGTYASQILDNICNHKNLTHVPYYILSAYENLSLGSVKEEIDGIFTKPLRKQYIEEILNNINIIE
jgi:signal transduction histidine kinase